MVRILPELSSLARFRRLNFMDDDFGFREPFDIIFCRNVIIYFDRPTQERLLSRLVENLESGRYIFLGHSETLLGLNRPLKQRDSSGLQEGLLFPAPLYPMRSGCISY
jgi:chemotaxis protein methyltransferase CheR